MQDELHSTGLSMSSQLWLDESWTVSKIPLWELRNLTAMQTSVPLSGLT